MGSLWGFDVPCTSPASQCEAPLTVAGGVGTCNATTGVCECPPGYTGRDFVVTWNECVSLTWLQELFRAFTTACVVLGFVAMVVLLWDLLRRWGVVVFQADGSVDDAAGGGGGGGADDAAAGAGAVESPAPESAPTPTPTPTPGVSEPRARRTSQLPTINASQLMSPKTNNPTQSYQQTLATRKRRQLTLWLVGNFLLFDLATLAVQITRHVGFNISDAFWVQLVGIWIQLTTIVWALWLGAYIWFSTLPSLRVFARMFPSISRNFLFRNPRLVKFLAVGNSVAVVVLMSSVLVWVLVSPQTVDIAASFFVTVFFLFVVTFCITMMGVCWTLLSVFQLFLTNDAPLAGNVAANANANAIVAAPSSPPALALDPATKSGGDSSPPTRARTASRAVPRGLGPAILTVRVMMLAVCFAGPGASALILCMGWAPGARRNWDELFSVLEITGIVVSLFVSGVIRRTT